MGVISWLGVAFLIVLGGLMMAGGVYLLLYVGVGVGFLAWNMRNLVH